MKIQKTNYNQSFGVKMVQISPKESYLADSIVGVVANRNGAYTHELVLKASDLFNNNNFNSVIDQPNRRPFKSNLSWEKIQELISDAKSTENAGIVDLTI